MSILQNVSFVISTNHFDELPSDSGREIAFAGRSNAGKSSAINTLTNKTRLAFVSKQPGRTQLINFFKIKDMQSLVDLPGYGFAKVPKPMKDHWRKLLPKYLQERKSLIGLVLVVDIRRELTELDTQMLDWFAPQKKPIHVLLTKSDKVSKDKSLRTLNKINNELKEKWGKKFNVECSAQLFSSLKKQGIEKATKKIEQWLT
ncbi:ribosome biogenesis GTP-binding protein YihA/YsxC [Methylophilaceae bacterium]|jgi:GTP-binding protein|nr:YihA family ribosome biogenesis GTP-binding protein [Nitrosomonadales bacterium]MCH9771069.1 ribosome biogenesis GTP-binding protein YihA/YsxC [Betaproteobacteria bacterium]MDA9086354.1 ribosome biogenesis GTP-binding protein YihA/YsxC [Methylophilaceae bacterium]